jgi:hypothetical protein
MSRYNITPRSDPTLEITAGWDAPLSTFFANVIRPVPDDVPFDSDQEDEILLCVGCKPYEYTSPAKIASAISEYADLGDEVIFKMLQDSVQPYKPSAIQQWVRNTLTKERE